jgi:hypothetical protein
MIYNSKQIFNFNKIIIIKNNLLYIQNKKNEIYILKISFLYFLVILPFLFGGILYLLLTGGNSSGRVREPLCGLIRECVLI